MAKFRSEIVQTEVKNSDGSVKIVGQTAWIPINDAAKAHKMVEKAMQLGKYKPTDPNERENMEKLLKARQVEDLKRKGMVKT